MSNEKSINLNMIFNAFQTLLSIIFPLITYPYISRIFGVELLGSVNFSSSIVSYFGLIAGIGIANYTIREGAKYRDDKEDIQKYCSEVFSINCFSTLFAYALLVIFTFAVPRLREDYIYILLISGSILFTTLSASWVLTIFEEYRKVATIRTISFAVSLIALFCFVKDKDDVYIYLIVQNVQHFVFTLIAVIYSKKFVNFKFTIHLNLKKHFRLLIVYFATTVSATIYVNSDTTMLGFICDEYTVGIYSSATKIYSIVKQVLISVMVVATPQLVEARKNEDLATFNSITQNLFESFLTLTLPAVLGLSLLSENIVVLISGEEFVEGGAILFILSFAAFFAMLAVFTAQPLVASGHERVVMVATIVVALLNIVLNIILIPLWQGKAAALTTIISEATVSAIQLIYFLKVTKVTKILRTVLQVALGCCGILAIVIFAKRFLASNVLVVVVSISASVVIYFLIEILVRNNFVMKYINGFKKIIKRKKTEEVNKE